MEEPYRDPLLAGWREVFRKTRALWGDDTDKARHDLFGARAHVLLENTFWLPVWLVRYDLDQYDRVEKRLMEVFAHGIAASGEQWAPDLLDLEHDQAAPGREQILSAATRLINYLSYHRPTGRWRAETFTRNED